MITRLIQLTIETGAVTVGAMVLRFVIYSYDMTTDAVVSMNNQEIVISPWPFSISISQLFVYVVAGHCPFHVWVLTMSYTQELLDNKAVCMVS